MAEPFDKLKAGSGARATFLACSSHSHISQPMGNVGHSAGAVTARELLQLVLNGMLAMYKLIADESGYSEQEKACVVTGFVGHESQWDDCTAKWDSVLNKFGVEAFHGIDFWDWHLDDETKEVVREHPYEGWADDDDYAFINELLTVIEDAKLAKSGAAIDVSLFLSLSEDERRWLTTSAVFGKDWVQRGSPNDPYFAAFQGAIIWSARYVPDGERLFSIFGLRDDPKRIKQSHTDKAREIYSEILENSSAGMKSRLGRDIVFADPRDVWGLQAADLLANRSRVYIAEGLGDYPLANRLRVFLEQRSGFVKYLGIRGLDLALAGCPFRSTFWRVDEFKTAQPDYLENMRREGKVLAYKDVGGNIYRSHHIKAHKTREVLRQGVYGSLVYIEESEKSIPPGGGSEPDK